MRRGEPMIGSKLKDKHATKWLAAIAPHLVPGETITALARTARVHPVLDGVAVTNARVVGFLSSQLGSGFTVEVSGDDIVNVETVKPSFSKDTLVVTRRGGRSESFGAVLAPDLSMVLGAVRHLAQLGPAPDPAAAVARQIETVERVRDEWDRVQVIGTQPNRGTWKAIKDHCSPGEVAWFVIGSLAAGAFAAFDDRCMIVKAGMMPSIGAGSFGGGRITTFPYPEITGIEYNAGLMSGVLEVLTASYSGTSNKDYWRGVGRNPNLNRDNPFALSNTLPLGRPDYQRALPRLNEMRAKIAESKRPAVVVAAAPPAPAGGLADELAKLAALRDQGVLTDAEFTTAKQRLLQQHGLA